MITNVYQYCSKCNTERSHKWLTGDTLSCVKCHKDNKISATRKVEADPELLIQLTTDPNPQQIRQPKAMLAFLKGVGV